MLALGPRFFILIGFLLRFGIAIWNGFYGPSIGAELDAITFHLEAADYAGNPSFDSFRIGWIYSNFLGLFYYATTPSLFIGSLLSCVAWLFSAFIFGSCLRILQVTRRMRVNAMLVYAFLPSSVFLTAVTLREPYQLLFVNLAIYGYLQIYLNGAVRHWITVIIAILGASSLHSVFIAWGVILVLSGLLIKTLSRSRKFSRIEAATFVVVIGVLCWCVILVSGNMGYDFDGGLLRAIGKFRRNFAGIEARTIYASGLENYEQSDLIFDIPVIFFQYLFEPFIWRITRIGDFVQFLENILRGWLIWRVCRALHTGQLDSRRFVSFVFIFILYLVMELMWSLGTLNWGTAVRHHVPAMGLLLLAAYARPVRRLNFRWRHQANDNINMHAPGV